MYKGDDEEDTTAKTGDIVRRHTAALLPTTRRTTTYGAGYDYPRLRRRRRHAQRGRLRRLGAHVREADERRHFDADGEERRARAMPLDTISAR